MKKPFTGLFRFAASLTIGLGLFLPATSFAATTFATHADYSAGTSPFSVATADFDGDGTLDLAVSNGTGNNDATVSILHGGANGTFGATSTFPVGNNPNSIAVADLNHDTKPDIVTANEGEATVSVLLNNGLGGFTTATLPAGRGTFSVAIVDLNHDGNSDIVATNAGDENISVYFGNGAGVFTVQPNIDFTTIGQPTFVTAGLLNNDVYPDLVVANGFADSITVVMNNGLGGFSTSTTVVGGNPSSVVIADFNNDNKLDLAVSVQASNSVVVLLGDGSGNFGAATVFPVGTFPTSMSVGDFNSDGKPDLATANFGTNNVSVILGDNTGHFGSPINFDVGVQTRGLAVGFFDDDQKLDIVTSNASENTVSVLLNTSTPDTIPYSYTRTPAGNGSGVSPISLHLTGTFGSDFCQRNGNVNADDNYFYFFVRDENQQFTVTPTSNHIVGDLVDETYQVNLDSANYFQVFLDCGNPLYGDLFTTLEQGHIFSVVPAASDTVAPVITTGPSDSGVTASEATINWTTNELSNAVVNYSDGTTAGTVSENWVYTNHAVTLRGLTPGTQYTYTVSSTDGYGNGPTTSGAASFTTPASDVPFSFTRTPSGGSFSGPVSFHVQGTFGATFCTRHVDDRFPHNPENDSYRVSVYDSLNSETFADHPHVKGDVVDDTFNMNLPAGDYVRMTLSCNSPVFGQLDQTVEQGALFTIVPTGPVSLWKGEGNAIDSIDGNNGVLSGAVSYGAGVDGQAFQFDGVSGAVEVDNFSGSVNVGNAANLHISSGDFSVGTWVKFNALNTDMSILDKSSGINTDGWRLIKQIDNRFWFCWGDISNHCGIGNDFTIYSTTVAQAGQWYHVVVTKSDGMFRIYVNGALQDSRAVPNFVDSNTNDLLLGSNVTQGAYLNGSLDEVFVDNSALSASEVASAYNSSKPTGTLIVKKHVVNDNGGTHVASDFTMTVTGTNPSQSTFLGDENGTSITLDVGSYSVSEIGVALVSPSYSDDCSGSIAAGQTKTCTVTNTVAPREIAVEVFAHDGPSTNLPLNYTTTGGNGLPSSIAFTYVQFSANQQAWEVTTDGPYSITPLAPPAGWTLDTSGDAGGESNICWDPVADPQGLNPLPLANFTVPGGHYVKCSFTYDYTAPSTPSITTVSLPAGVVGTAYSQTLQETGGTAPFTWSKLSGTLPAGLTLSSAGVLSGTPTASSSKTFTVKVTDAANASATQVLTLQIVKPLVLNTASLPAGKVGAAYSKALVAAQGALPYTWTVIGGALPDGLSLDSSSGVVSGTPTDVTIGTSNVTIQVSDNASQTASKSYSVNITALHITTASIPNGKVGAAYSKNLAATGGTTPLTWSVTTGDLDGLTLSPGGVISGAPTAAGTFSVTVQVSDTNGITDTKSYSFVINTLHVTTTNIPKGIVGAPYNKNLAAAGGTTPYTWSLFDGALPTGLSVDPTGAIVGTPTAAGAFTFTLQVTDANSVSDTMSFTASTTRTTITTASLPNAKVGNAYSKTMAANNGTAPYTWSVVGTLPTGLTLSSAGVISGTPTVAGTPSVSLHAIDANGINDVKPFTLLIKP